MSILLTNVFVLLNSYFLSFFSQIYNRVNFLEFSQFEFWIVLAVLFIIITCFMFWNILLLNNIPKNIILSIQFIVAILSTIAFFSEINLDLQIFDSMFISRLGFLFILVLSLLIISKQTQANVVFDQAVIFFLLMLVWSFSIQTNSLIMFYLILEIFSVYFFFLVFNQKNVSNNFEVNFLSIIFNIFASISFLFFMYIYYTLTGCLVLLPTAISSMFPEKWIMALLLFLFLIFKLGFFLIFPLYLIFYSEMPKKPFFISNILIKTFILYFCFENIQTLGQIFEIKPSAKIEIFYWILVSSLILAIISSKIFTKNNPVSFIYIAGFCSVQIILLLILIYNMEKTPTLLLFSIIQYYLISSIVLLSTFVVKQYFEFLFCILIYLGFPGIVFFAKITLFEIIFVNNLFLLGLFPIFGIVLLLFIQEFHFSSNVIKSKTKSDFLFIYILATAFSIGFSMF